jgi:hypothetical protein
VKFDQYGGDGSDPVLPTAYLGFSAATGGAVAFHEVDNIEVTLYPNEGGDPLPTRVRGDSNSSGVVDLTDGVVTLNFLFIGGPAPACQDAADTDNNGALVISNAVVIFSYLFIGGPPPVEPTPSSAVYPRPIAVRIPKERTTDSTVRQSRRSASDAIVA